MQEWAVRGGGAFPEEGPRVTGCMHVSLVQGQQQVLHDMVGGGT